MNNKIILLMLAIALVFMGCGKPSSTQAAAPAAAPATSGETKAVSDGSTDLTIDYQINLAEGDEANRFYWKGNIRYMAAEDSYDAVSGASAQGSTHLFQAYLYDVEGKATMSTGLRGLFLFAVTPYSQIEVDNLTASKASDGSIVIQYVHRGTAYRFTTDSKGVLSLPDGSFESRKIGTPQELEAAFTSDGTAQGVDFAKVWSSDVADAGASPEAMYVWDGDLKVTLENDILTINGILTSVVQ